jgi:hypothetical protein
VRRRHQTHRRLMQSLALSAAGKSEPGRTRHPARLHGLVLPRRTDDQVMRGCRRSEHQQQKNRSEKYGKPSNTTTSLRSLQRLRDHIRRKSGSARGAVGLPLRLIASARVGRPAVTRPLPRLRGEQALALSASSVYGPRRVPDRSPSQVSVGLTFA